MSEFPSFPLLIDRYLADTEHLSFEEHGAYLRLLMAMWIAPNQRLPNDDKWLARRFRCSESVVANLLRPLIKELCQSSGNWISQKQLRVQHDRVKAIRDRQSVRAKVLWKNKKTSTASYAEPQSSACNVSYPILNKKDAAELPLLGQRTEEAELFDRGKKILGTDAGGLIARLLKAKGSVSLARAAIETASTKQNPREYIGAMLRKQNGGQGPIPGII